MQPKAILLGAFGVLADTSDMQRRAFNRAFEEAGLDWSWDRESYAPMLATVGGQNRIAEYARKKGVNVDTPALHAAKSRIFQELLRTEPLRPRRGVRQLLDQAHRIGVPVGWVTTTARANLDAALDGFRGAITSGDFALIVDRSQVEVPKPGPDCYFHALDALGMDAPEVICIEDTPESLAAARKAGIYTIAFPGAVPPGSTWYGAQAVVDDLSGILNGNTLA